MNKADFKKLKDKWYKKLEKSGFEDVESDEYNLKSWSSVLFLRKTPESWEAKATYYQMASNFLEEYKFDSNIEKTIWEYHSNGLSARNTSVLLKKARVKSIATSKSKISEIVYKLKMKMYEMYIAKKPEYLE